METRHEAKARFQAAMEQHRRGRLDSAERLYRETLELTPDNAVAHNNLGLTLAARDQVAEAAECFQRALELDPLSTDAARNLAQARHHCGQYREALECCRKLLQIDPQPSGARLQIVALHQLLGESGESQQAALEAAAAITSADPCFGQLIATLEACADEAISAGQVEAAWKLASSLCRLQPENIPATRMLAHCLRQAYPQSDDPRLDMDLRLCLASRHLDHQALTRPCLALLRIRYPALDAPEPDPAMFIHSALGHDPLFIAWLGNCLNTDRNLELQLSELRGRLLQQLDKPLEPAQPTVDLMAALSLHCFANEYLYPEDPGESSVLDTLTAGLLERSKDWRDLGPGDYPKLLVLGCYRPWYRLPKARELDASLNLLAPDWLREPQRRLLSEPLEEQAIRQRLQGASITDPVSRAVRRQYEQSPYPRWQCLEPEPADSVSGYLRHLFPHYRPAALLDSHPGILIAGCGTGEHAIRVALRHPDSEVIAIDLSLASLAYAQRQAQALKVPNLSWRQADILELPDFEQSFQVIESVGVLHHLATPAKGLTALVDVLDRGGVIKLGLYSQAARRHVTLARQRIAALGLGNQSEDIRALRSRILNGLEPDLEPLLASPDFFSLSNCRDLLFHVQEHQYDIRAIEALLKHTDLEWIGFQLPDPKVTRRYREINPGDPNGLQLARWHSFEQQYPDTFAGMYQFWCRRR